MKRKRPKIQTTVKIVTMLQADWLVAPFTKAVVTALGAGNIKFVGGAVRDTLLGLEVADIDAATVHKPAETMALLKAASIKVIPTGLKHGTVTAVQGGQTIEITTLRIDTETDGRHAEVAFTTDWLEDAKRRDFTFNALYTAPDGSLFDPFEGLIDLKAGTVRFIGDAGERIEEDALRILRFFRFYGKYGKGEPNVEAMAACSAKRTMLARLSVERVRDELLKILAQPSPDEVLALMEQCGVLQKIFGNRYSSEKITAFIHSGAQLNAPNNPLVRLYLLGQPSLNAVASTRKFKLSNDERRFLVRLEEMQSGPCPKAEREIHQSIYKYGADVVRACAVGEDAELYRLIARVCGSWTVPQMPVQGSDLLRAGWDAGPNVGACLKDMEARWIESDFSLSKSQLLDSI